MTSILKTRLGAFVALLLAGAPACLAQNVLVQYNLAGATPLAPSTVNAGLASSTSITFGGYAGAWTEPSSGVLQENPGAPTTAALAVASGNYATFTLTSTQPMDLSSLTFGGAYGQFSNPAGYALQTSVDGFSSVVSTAAIATQSPTFTTQTINLSGTSFQGLTSITFRVFGYVANSGEVMFGPFTVNGTLGSPLSAANTTISPSPASITANGTSTSTLTVQARAANGSNMISSGGSVTLNASAGSLGTVTDNGNGTYTAILTSSTTAGTANITGTIAGVAIGNTTVVTFTPGPVSAANSSIGAAPASVPADGTSTSTLTVQARDANNNNLGSSGGGVTLNTSTGSLGTVTDNGNGTYTATLTSSTTAGTANITGTIAGATIGQPTSVTFTGLLSPANTTITANPSSIQANGTSTSTLTVTCQRHKREHYYDQQRDGDIECFSWFAGYCDRQRERDLHGRNNLLDHSGNGQRQRNHRRRGDWEPGLGGFYPALECRQQHDHGQSIFDHRRWFKHFNPDGASQGFEQQ